MTKVFKKVVKSIKIRKTMSYKKRITKKTNSGKLRKAPVSKLEEMLIKGLVMKTEKKNVDEDVKIEESSDDYKFNEEIGEFEYDERTNEFDNLNYQSNSEDGDEEGGELKNGTNYNGDEKDEESGY